MFMRAHKGQATFLFGFEICLFPHLYFKLCCFKNKLQNLKTEDSDDESEQEQTLLPPKKKSKKSTYVHVYIYIS